MLEVARGVVQEKVVHTVRGGGRYMSDSALQWATAVPNPITTSQASKLKRGPERKSGKQYLRE